MSTDTAPLDNLAGDADFEEFTALLSVLARRMDDPEELEALLDEGQDTEALSRVLADRENTENALTDLYELACAIHETHPETIERLREQMDCELPPEPPNSE